MGSRLFLATLLLVAQLVTQLLYSTEDVANYACNAVSGPLYTDSDREEISEYCAYTKIVRDNLPNVYWLPSRYYQKFLNNLPIEKQASNNLFTEMNADAEMSRILDKAEACHFYSSISNSVLGGYVAESERTKIITDIHDLILECTEMRNKILNGDFKSCSVIEFAGHSTQAIGLDTVFGVDYNFGSKKVFPNQNDINKVAECVQSIAAPQAWITMSTCGGERNENGIYHYWKNKEKAQQDFANLMKLPIVSGIGPVRAASKYGENGVESPHGWHISYPQP